MKIPQRINIFSEIYTVKFEPDIFPNNTGKMLQGQADYTNKTIRIVKADTVSMLKTLSHEIIHIICSELNLYSDEHDEAFIDRLATGFIDTMIRNNIIKGGEK